MVMFNVQLATVTKRVALAALFTIKKTDQWAWLIDPINEMNAP